MAEIRWYGHTCFRTRAREATILNDPVSRTTGYLLPKSTTADIVTLSSTDNPNLSLDGLKTEATILRGPGEYEVHDVFLTGTRTFRDANGGTERGFNTAYVFEVEGMHICHLGTLGHALSPEQAEAVANTDILLIPVGGGELLEPAVAAEVVAQIAPKIVIPMQFATEQGDKQARSVDQFCKELGLEVPAPEEKLTIRSSELGETVRIVTLQPTRA